MNARASLRFIAAPALAILSGCSSIETPGVVLCSAPELATDWKLVEVWRDSSECNFPEGWSETVSADEGIYVFSKLRGPGHAAVLAEAQINRGERAQVHEYKRLEDRVFKVAYGTGRVPKVVYQAYPGQPLETRPATDVEWIQVVSPHHPSSFACGRGFAAMTECYGFLSFEWSGFRVFAVGEGKSQQVAEGRAFDEDLLLAETSRGPQVLLENEERVRILSYDGRGELTSTRTLRLSGNAYRFIEAGDVSVVVSRRDDSGLQFLWEGSSEQIRYEWPGNPKYWDLGVLGDRLVVASQTDDGSLSVAAISRNGRVQQASFERPTGCAIRFVIWHGRAFLLFLNYHSWNDPEFTPPMLRLEELLIPGT